MESGVVTQESLAAFLGQSERRRNNGVLELTYPERVLELRFSQGKIVEIVVVVDGAAINPAQEVLARLEQGGFVPHGCIEAPEYIAHRCYESLWESLNEKGIKVESSIFRRAVRHRLLDRFFELDLDSGGIYSFKPQRVDYDREYCPKVSLAELLLDFVALQADTERFRSAFSQGAVVARAADGPPPESEEEAEILSSLDTPLTVEVLRGRSLLSRFSFEDGLLSLLERGAVVLPGSNEAREPNLKPQSEKVSEALTQAAETVSEASSVIAEVEAEAKLPPPPAKATKGAETPKVSISERLTRSALPAQCGAILFLLAALLVPVFVWAPAFFAF